MAEEEKEIKMKICLLGDGGVGKTSLVYRFIQNRFSTDFKSTLGVNLLKHEVAIDHIRVTVQIWDLGGQDKYEGLRKLYLDGSQGALLVFDKTNKKSYENLEKWVRSFRDLRGGKPMLLIGNKLDLKEFIVIDDETAESYSKSHDLDYISTSAKTGEKVETAFTSLIKKIIENNPP
ncbi:MAG: GTP-binding protein [Candidatus Lokiarchaeota archaeon]|nr:GTP-binding protein [Candidatus Lokiarchaeota archaeon]